MHKCTSCIVQKRRQQRKTRYVCEWENAHTTPTMPTSAHILHSYTQHARGRDEICTSDYRHKFSIMVLPHQHSKLE